MAIQSPLQHCSPTAQIMSQPPQLELSTRKELVAVQTSEQHAKSGRLQQAVPPQHSSPSTHSGSHPALKFMHTPSSHRSLFSQIMLQSPQLFLSAPITGMHKFSTPSKQHFVPAMQAMPQLIQFSSVPRSVQVRFGGVPQHP